MARGRIRGRTALAALLLSSASAALHGDVAPFDLRWSHATPGAGYRGEVLEVVDLDGDGAAEIVLASCSGFCWSALTRGGRAYRQVATSVPGGPLATLRAGRPGNGPPLVLAAAAERLELTARRGDGTVTRTLTLATSEPADLALADLAGDGSDRLVVIDWDTLFIYDPASGALLSTWPGLGGVALDVGQLDGDAAVEIAVATGVGTCHVVDGATFLVEWSAGSCGPEIAVGDLVAGGSAELLTATGSEWSTWALRAWQLPSATPLWEREPYYFETAALAIADIDPAPGAEVLWGGEGSDALWLFGGADGALLRTYPQPGARALGAGDTDADGRVELALLRGPGNLAEVIVLDAQTGAVEHAVPHYFLQSRGLAAGDVDGDGDRELVAGGWAEFTGSGPYAHAMIFAGRDGAGPLSAPLSGTPWWNGMISQFRLADLEDDGDLELCVTYSVGLSYVGCFELPGLTPLWTAQRSPVPSELLLADLDGDALPELLVERHWSGDESYVDAFDPRTGLLLWTSPNLAPGTTDVGLLCVGEIDSAPGVDVVAGDGSGRFSVLDRSAGTLVRALDSPADAGLECGDLDRDGDLELVGNDFQTVGELDSETGAWTRVIASTAFAVLAVGDLFGDQAPELAGTGPDGRLVVLDAASGRELWSRAAEQPLDWYSGSLEVLDTDGDGRAELVSSSMRAIAVFGRRPGGSVLFVDGFESGDTVYWSRARS